MFAPSADDVRDFFVAARHKRGASLWEAQRSGRPPDGAAYGDCVRRRATR